MKNREREILKSTKKYDYFGHYLVDANEPPVFVEKSNSHDFNFDGVVYTFSPKMLISCVKNLTDDRKIEEAGNIAYFKDKCKQIANYYNEYPAKSWNTAINGLVIYLSNFAKENNIEDIIK